MKDKTPMQKKDKTKEIIKGMKSAIEDVRKGRYIELKSRQDMNKTPKQDYKKRLDKSLNRLDKISKRMDNALEELHKEIMKI